MKRSYNKYKILTIILIAVIMIAGCQAVNTDVQGPLNNLNSFTAYTNKGESFTQEDFADYDVVVICFWAPWSDASIYEMKNLAELSERFPDNVSFVSVGLDMKIRESKTRLKELDLKKITTLVDGDGDFKTLTDSIVNIPTTILIDNGGNIIGNPVIGIQEDYEKIYVSLINKAMKKLGKRKIVLEKEEKEAFDSDN